MADKRKILETEVTFKIKLQHWENVKPENVILNAKQLLTQYPRMVKSVEVTQGNTVVVTETDNFTG